MSDGRIEMNVSKSYGEQEVFKELSLSIEKGKILCVLGESGGGKTTLLNMLAGMIPYDGSIENAPDKVGYIFQEPRLLPNLTVEENLRYAGGRVELIDEILRKTELSDKRNKRPGQLSGGEKQRVAIARAFLSEADTLLLDEPFSSLDTALKIRLARVFAALWREKCPTVAFVTHDVEEAWMLGHRVVVLRKRNVVADVELPQTELPREYGSGGAGKEKLLKIVCEE